MDITSDANTEPMIIPMPKQMHMGRKRVLLPYMGNIRIIANGGADMRHLSVIASQLCDDLFRMTGVRWNTTAGTGWLPTIDLVVDDALSSSSYHLLIRANKPSSCAFIRAIGGDVNGLRFAVQTLRQLLRQYGCFLPTLEIIDYPSMGVRALSYDISRGRVPTLESLKTLVDELCLFKYNQLQLYVEHTIDFDDSSEAWSGQDPVTSSDILSLDEYCHDRGIELVPAIATFGHMYDVLRTRQYRHLGEHPEMAERSFSFVERMLHHTFNPIDPEAIDFVLRRMDEYAALFQSRQINIGADETFDLGTGRSRHEALRCGIKQLYIQYVRRLCSHAIQNGLRPIMYADIALKYPEMLEMLPDSVALANWDYSAYPAEANVEQVSRYGFTQYVCPGVQTWNRLLPNLDAAWTNISAMCSYGHRYGAAGMIVTDWGDYGHVNDPVMSIPGILYAAECSWNEQPLEHEKITHIASVLGFADQSTNMIEVITRASRAQAFSWSDAVQYKELDSKGSLNPDVAHVLGQPSEDTLEQSRARFLNDRRSLIELANEYDEILEQCEFDCAKIFAGSVVDGGVMMTVRLMIDGQRILNRIGACLIARQTSSCDDSLPYDIERWRSAYEHRWRSIGVEAGLSRIGSVLSWYAGFCRDTNSNEA